MGTLVRFGVAAVGRPDVPPVRLHLRHDGPGYCLHEPLRRHSPRAAALERWVIAVADASKSTEPGVLERIDRKWGQISPS